MMKKLLFLIGLLAAATLPAVDLLDFCPSAADGALRIDVEKILKHPKLAEMLSEKKLKKQVDSENALVVDQIRNSRSVLIFYVGEADTGGALIESSSLRDLPAALTMGKRKFSSRKISGYDALIVEDEKSGNTALIQLTDDVLLAADESDAEKLVNSPRGNPVKVKAQMASLPSQNAPVWLVGQAMLPSDEGVEQLYRLCGTFEYNAAGTEYTVQALLDCPNEETASQLKMMADLMASAGISAAFSEDQKLGKAILKKLKFSTKKQQLRGKFVVNDDLLTRITSYVEKHPGMFSALDE